MFDFLFLDFYFLWGIYVHINKQFQSPFGHKEQSSVYDRAIKAPELTWHADRRTGAPRCVHLSTSL